MSFELSAPLGALLETIQRFEHGEVVLETLQAAIRSAEESVTEYELRDLRRFLQSAEGQLELIRFTVETDYARAEALKVAHDVRSNLQRVALASP